MILDENISDETLEYAAMLIEEASFTDLRGIAAKRKRDREDAELRYKTIQETRQECASLIRAFKNRPELSPVSVLRDLSELSPDGDHAPHLRDAWPLAWKGWVNIECRVICNSNWVPPESHYRIILTERGKAKLAEADNATRDTGGNNG
jgi:hypothetical protein